MTMNRHEPFEELISASLTGDLTADERQRLDAHLDSCAHCRATLAAFAEQRRIMAGLRHVAPPRDLGARVRTGSSAAVRDRAVVARPAVMFAGVGGSLAAVAGALLALVLLNGTPTSHRSALRSHADATLGRPMRGHADPTCRHPDPAARPRPRRRPPAPSGSVGGADPTPAEPKPDRRPRSRPRPSRTSSSPSPGPSDEPRRWRCRRRRTTPATRPPRSSAPAGRRSPPSSRPTDSGLRSSAEVGLSGRTSCWPPASPRRRAVGRPGRSAADRIRRSRSARPSCWARRWRAVPFLERMAWSPDGRLPRLHPRRSRGDRRRPTSWIFEAGERRGLAAHRRRQRLRRQLGVSARTASPLLWVSAPAHGADELPRPGRSTPTTSAVELIDPADGPASRGRGRVPAAAQPERRAGDLLARPHGSRPRRWLAASSRAAPRCSPQQSPEDDDGSSSTASARSSATCPTSATPSPPPRSPGAATATPTRSGTPRWTGGPQGGRRGDYPDPARVYFGHATDPRGLTRVPRDRRRRRPRGLVGGRRQGLADGRHLVITAREPLGGDLDPPRADLLLVERNTGDVADGVAVLGSAERRLDRTGGLRRSTRRPSSPEQHRYTLRRAL